MQPVAEVTIPATTVNSILAAMIVAGVLAAVVAMNRTAARELASSNNEDRARRGAEDKAELANW